jgi:hypothetical protein
MKKLFVMAFALTIGAFVLAAGHSSANAAAATAPINAVQTEVAKDNGSVTQVHWHGGWHGYGWRGYGWRGYGWRGYGWGYGYGWRGYGWRGYGWPGYGWGYWGCPWRCGPYGCWRACW